MALFMPRLKKARFENMLNFDCKCLCYHSLSLFICVCVCVCVLDVLEQCMTPSCFLNYIIDTNCLVVSGMLDVDDAEMRKAR